MATLVTIPASNYAEKARWALQLAGIPFAEAKYAPLLAYMATMPRGGKSVPLLVVPAENLVLKDSADILDYCATKRPELYPSPHTKELELMFDQELGPHARRCAYHILFADSVATWRILAGPLDSYVQYFLAWLLRPILKAMLMRALNVNAKSAERSWAKIERILEETGKRLGDGAIGTRFLDGSTLSAADITFCAHMSLLLAPQQHSYIAPYISVDRIKDPIFRQRIEKLQQSKVGEHVVVVECSVHLRVADDAIHQHVEANIDS
ncbi:hypothetical protein FI667_g6473, partial [Globisporangium splendens]